MVSGERSQNEPEKDEKFQNYVLKKTSNPTPNSQFSHSVLSFVDVIV